MGWAEDPQEAFDNHLINYRVGEDKRIYLPQFVCQDGYFVSHIPGKVVLPDQKQVDEFLPPLKMDHRLDPKKPISHGPQIRPDQGDALELARAMAMSEVPKVVKEAIDDFGRIFGRKYSPFVEEYMLDDADMAIFIQGAHAATARAAIQKLRKQGVKIGMAKLRFVRPWPTEAVAAALGKVKAVAVVETNTSFGGATQGGALMFEVCTSLYDLPKKPLVTSFMAGLGGEVVKIEDFEYMAKHLAKAIKEGKVCKRVHWIGFEPE
jgi:pyruvate ferredoxin oxidoreductase alpha subunit/oxalate oxidoreductase subunit alpha